jgi:hypothetical protein
MSGTRFVFKVVGEGKVRARGELAFVLPQALDLVSKTSYTASVSEALPNQGVLHLKRTEQGIEAQYQFNPNPALPMPETPPAWLQVAGHLSTTLGKQVTWAPPP